MGMSGLLCAPSGGLCHTNRTVQCGHITIIDVKTEWKWTSALKSKKTKKIISALPLKTTLVQFAPICRFLVSSAALCASAGCRVLPAWRMLCWMNVHANGWFWMALKYEDSPRPIYIKGMHALGRKKGLRGFRYAIRRIHTDVTSDSPGIIRPSAIPCWMHRFSYWHYQASLGRRRWCAFGFRRRQPYFWRALCKQRVSFKHEFSINSPK